MTTEDQTVTQQESSYAQYLAEHLDEHDEWRPAPLDWERANPGLPIND